MKGLLLRNKSGIGRDTLTGTVPLWTRVTPLPCRGSWHVGVGTVLRQELTVYLLANSETKLLNMDSKTFDRHSSPGGNLRFLPVHFLA